MSSSRRTDKRRHRTWTLAGIALLLAGLFSTSAALGQARPPKVTSPRLYIFDHGHIRLTPDTVRNIFGAHFDPDKFSHSRDMVTPFHLIVHPKGTLIWESGNPDSMMNKPSEEHKPGRPLNEPPLKSLPDQLAIVGYKPEDITYYAFSHYHADHAGNSNLFTRSTWLVRKAERDFILSDKPAANMVSHLSALKSVKTVVIENDEYDVFGDGTVVLMNAQGHTLGQQALFLKLAKSGPIILVGDLYHYIEERPPLNWFPPKIEADPKQSRESRARIEEFVKKTGARLWIDHELDAYAKRKKAPEYYE